MIGGNSEPSGPHGYSVALFDILGFESLLNTFGLSEMLTRYRALIWSIGRLQAQKAQVFGALQLKEAPYWTKEGGVAIFSKVQGAYASDSLLLWANRTWPEARGKSIRELADIAKDPARGWKASPVPCDNFLDACNEIMCHGLQVGLPLRGAISMGEAVFDEDRRIFLGAPMVEAARLEKEQRFIGAGLCKSFRGQIIPKRFFLEFDGHLKAAPSGYWGGAVLDWPRHWRNTRKLRADAVVSSMNTSPSNSSYYENTLRTIELSSLFADRFEGEADIEIRGQYPEFSFGNELLEVSATAVRRVTVGAEAGSP